MKALLYDRYGPPDVLTIRNVSTPQPDAGQVLVRVHALPVGPGDCKTRAGELRGFFEVTFPKIPGRYASGDVVATGAGVSWPQPGDAVVLASVHSESGTAAEFLLCSPSQVALKPCNFGHVEAAAIIQGGVCAYICVVECGRVTSGTRVLVHGGAGVVGSACVELAHHLGAHVTASCRTADIEFVRGLGADVVVPFDVPGAVEGAVGQDLVIDPIGGEVHARSYRLLRAGGRLVYLNALPIEDRGREHGVTVVNARIDARAVVLDAAARLVERGVLRPRVAAVVPLHQAAAAHRMVEAGGVKRGRVVLVVD